MGDQKRRILVIDDDPGVLQLLGEMLEDEGYCVHLLPSGKNVNEVLRNEVIDLLVLDLAMPEPDGFDVLKSIRKSMPGLKILVISGYLQGGLLKAAQVMGATATLAKTDVPQKLLSTVEGLLRTHPALPT